MTPPRKFGLCVGALTICAAAAIALHARPKPIFSPGHAMLRILEVRDGKAVAEAMTAPRFEFRVEQGQVNEHDVLELEQKTEMRETRNVKYPVLVLEHGDVKLSLLGADLTVKK